MRNGLLLHRPDNHLALGIRTAYISPIGTDADAVDGFVVLASKNCVWRKLHEGAIAVV